MAEIRFIDRDALGQICGTYACRQREGQESLAEDHPELVAWQQAMEAARADLQNVEQARAAELRALADHQRTAPRKLIAVLEDAKGALLAERNARLALEARLEHLVTWAKTRGYPGYTP